MIGTQTAPTSPTNLERRHNPSPAGVMENSSIRITKPTPPAGGLLPLMESRRSPGFRAMLSSAVSRRNSYDACNLSRRANIGRPIATPSVPLED